MHRNNSFRERPETDGDRAAKFVAVSLTGWTQTETAGLLLDFRIVNQGTRPDAEV